MSAVIHLSARVLRNGLPGLVALLLGIALLEFVQPILFNEFGGVRELNAMVDLIPPMLQAFVRTRSEFLALSGLPGYLALGFTYPLYLLLAAAAVIGFAANSLAGEMDRGTIQTPLSRAISRPAVYVSRMLGMALICVLLALTGPVGMTLGILYARPEGEFVFAHFGAVALNGLALFWAIGGLTLLGSAAASTAGRVVGWAIGLLVLSYFVDYFAGIWSQLRVWTNLSLFAYYDPASALVNGQIQWKSIITLAVVGAVAMFAGLLVFARRDLPVETGADKPSAMGHQQLERWRIRSWGLSRNVPGLYSCPGGIRRRGEVTTMPQWLYGLIQAGLTVIALIVIILLLAGLFMIIFGIATGIDDRIQD